MSKNNEIQITYQTKEEEQPIYDEMVSFQALGIATCLAFPMVFKAALELGIIHIIASLDKDVWLSSYEIVSKLPTKPTNPDASVLIDRMLFLLASHLVLKCRTNETGRVYAAEPVCKFFLNPSGDGSGSLMPLFMFNQSQVSFESWTHLKDVIQEGSDSFISAHGMKVFEYIGLNKPVGELFNRAMLEASTIFMKKVLEVYKGFEDINTLVDVGGGLGTALHSITSKYPNIKGINFDLPQVFLTSAPVYPGIENIPGDMFIEIPKADAIFMKEPKVPKNRKYRTETERVPERPGLGRMLNVPKFYKIVGKVYQKMGK